MGSPEIRARHILSTLKSLVSSYYPEYIAGSTNMSLKKVGKRKKKILLFLNANLKFKFYLHSSGKGSCGLMYKVAYE